MEKFELTSSKYTGEVVNKHIRQVKGHETDVQQLTFGDVESQPHGLILVNKRSGRMRIYQLWDTFLPRYAPRRFKDAISAYTLLPKILLELPKSCITKFLLPKS
ncbi:hypothetical protein ACTXT7_015229 [Hymenolepis weldensis]